MPNVTMTPELEQAVRAASSPEAIQSAIQAELARQTSATEAEAATAAAAKIAAEKVTAANAGVTRTEVIGGQEFTFTGANQAEVDQLVLNAYRVAYAVGGNTGSTREEVQIDPAQANADVVAAQAAADAETARQTELGLKFQRGEISVKEYLEESGAVSEFLEKEGISIDALKQSVQKNQDESYKADWQSATAAFLAGPGAEWPGGDVNKFNLQNTLVALDLMYADDKVEALVKAYEHMKQNGALLPYVPPVDAAAQAIGTSSAAGSGGSGDSGSAAVSHTPEELQAIVQAAVSKALADQAVANAAAVEAAKSPRTSSSVFGASSGVAGAGSSVVGSTEARVRSDVAATAALKDASPAEILDAWKTAQVASGKNPNEAFMENFSSRRPA